MKIKTQKILMFIPILNFIPFLCWPFHISKNRVPLKYYFPTYIKYAGVTLATALLFLISQYIFNSDLADTIALYVCGYLMLVGIDAVQIADQKKYEESLQKKKKRKLFFNF